MVRKAVKFQMVTEKISTVDKFKLLEDLGYDGTEIPVGDKYDRREVARAIEPTGLPVHGVINAANLDLRGAIDLAKYPGGDSVLVVADEDQKQTYQQNFQAWQKLIRSAVEHAEKNEVKFC